jgi:hypothetical protein
MRRVIVAGTALVTALTLTATAHAGPYLGKREARGYAKKQVDKMAFDMDWTDGYRVEGHRRCKRVSRSIVECDYQLYDATTVCDGTIRIVERRPGAYSHSYPYVADCREIAD